MFSRNLIYALFLVAGVTLGAIARGAIDDGEEARPAPLQATPAAPARAPFKRPGAGDDAAVLDMLESLSNALNRETEYRQTLEEQILELEERVDALQASVRSPGGTRQPDMKLARDRAERAGGLTVERLMEAGLDEREANAIKARVDDLAMRRLYLRDEAMRDGWLGSQRYREESRNLTTEQNNLRTEFGDNAYDRYLYAAGRSNRVSVQSVIGESPAYNAGLQSGDRILSYNGQPTHSPGDLRRATQEGTAGEMVALQVIRNGRTVEIYVPRGPLGVQMRGVSEKP